MFETSAPSSNKNLGRKSLEEKIIGHRSTGEC